MSNRKLKKFRKNSYLMMDLAAIPSGTSVEDWLRIMNEHKILIWDSENNRGKLAKPKDYQPFKFIATTRIKCPYKIININNMTYHSRLIQVRKKSIRIGDIYEIDLSEVPKGMTFDVYLQSDLYKKERDKLFKALVDEVIKNKYFGKDLETNKTDYILDDDTKAEKEA